MQGLLGRGCEGLFLPLCYCVALTSVSAVAGTLQSVASCDVGVCDRACVIAVAGFSGRV